MNRGAPGDKCNRDGECGPGCTYERPCFSAEKRPKLRIGDIAVDRDGDTCKISAMDSKQKEWVRVLYFSGYTKGKESWQMRRNLTRPKTISCPHGISLNHECAQCVRENLARMVKQITK